MSTVQLLFLLFENALVLLGTTVNAILPTSTSGGMFGRSAVVHLTQLEHAYLVGKLKLQAHGASRVTEKL
jgi:hypothetical protein